MNPDMKIDIVEDMRRALLTAPDLADQAEFPRLDNLSAGLMFTTVPRPQTSEIAEFIYVPELPAHAFSSSEEEARYEVVVAEWNTLWEAAHLRHEMFEERLPPQLQWVKSLRGRNVAFVPLVKPVNYQAYAPLYHLLPPKLLRQFGLPFVTKGLWPFTVSEDWTVRFLPTDFNRRLAAAFAQHVWPFLVSGSHVTAFSGNDPIHLLAHNLDFWLPYADRVVQERLQAFGRRVPGNRPAAKRLHRMRKQVPEGVEVNWPLTGGYVWCGVNDAIEATESLIRHADEHGHLRGIVDAVRSHRVEEDFSPEWSYAREDFERRLYKKRQKIKVSFVQLDDTIPVHGPEAEVHENLLWQDLFAVLSERERHIVVCLRNGTTKVGNIARELGYANHSPVSKALSRIRRKAKSLLERAT